MKPRMPRRISAAFMRLIILVRSATRLGRLGVFLLKRWDRDHFAVTGLTRFRFVEDHRADYPVRVLCGALEVPPAGYYAWRSSGEPSIRRQS